MLNILIAENDGPHQDRLEQAVALMDECTIEHSRNEGEIKARLLSGQIDVYFDEYELNGERVFSMIDLIRKNDLPTAAITLAEPRNYALLYENSNSSINVCLLKPVQTDKLLFVLQRIADRKIFLDDQEDYQPSASALMNRVRGLLLENFWREMLGGQGVTSGKYLDQAARSVGVRNINEKSIYPILYMSTDHDRDWRFANHKEIFESMANALVIREDEGYTYYVPDGVQAILFQPYSPDLSTNRIVLRCYQYCQEMERQFGYGGFCVIGEPCSSAQLHERWLALHDCARRNRFRHQKIFFENDKKWAQTTLLYPPIEEWCQLIVRGRKNEIINQVRHFFDANQDNPGLTREFSVSLSFEINRSVIISMAEKGIFARQDSHLLTQYLSSADTPEEFLTWIAALTDWCTEQTEYEIRSTGVLNAAISYIKKNLSEPLKRQEIADHVHVSQNYLARLFKKNMGITISDYIAQQRMELAANLLATTAIPVTEIALQVGFAAQTYFSSCFHSYYGKSPRKYRKEARQKQ